MTVLKDIRPALRAILLGDAGIVAIVGERVYAVRMPQGVTAASVVYNRISGAGDYHMQGPSGLVPLRMQVVAWAASQDSADTLARLVKARLDGFSGTVSYGSNSPQDQVVVRGAFVDNERDDYDDTSKLYGVGRDFMIWYAEF